MYRRHCARGGGSGAARHGTRGGGAGAMRHGVSPLVEGTYTLAQVLIAVFEGWWKRTTTEAAAALSDGGDGDAILAEWRTGATNADPPAKVSSGGGADSAAGAAASNGAEGGGGEEAKGEKKEKPFSEELRDRSIDVRRRARSWEGEG